MRLPITILVVALVTGSFIRAQDERPVDFEILIRGGSVIDGTGAPAAKVDIGIRDGKIAAVGDLGRKTARTAIDAGGLAVAPGFIDLHSHSDDEILLPATRMNTSFLMQGVTTVVTGNCGMGHVEVAKYFAKAEKSGIGTNVLHLVPHGSIRERAMQGSFDRAPTPDEMREMKRLLKLGLDEGAVGMSTGLIYTPGSFSKTDELIELARVLAANGALYASHIRGEGDHLIEAVKEALAIGREAKCRVEISHLKCVGPANHGKAREATALIEAARAAGVRVFADQYPYTASSTSLSAMVFPEWSRAGTRADMLRRIDDPADGKRIREFIARGFEERGGAETVKIASFDADPSLNGKSMKEAAETLKMEVVDLAIDIQRRGGAQAVSFAMSEDDVRFIMKKDWVACASDGSSVVRDPSRPHPRSYGTFPRRIGRYAIEDGETTIEAAVRASSGLPADILGLSDRGYLKVAQAADIVVFDPKTFIDRATFVDPHQLSTGVRFLLVNGHIAVRDGEVAGVLAGKTIPRPRP